MIKRPYMAHESAVIDGENDLNGYIDPQIGAGTKIWHFCHVSAGAKIGSNCVLGQNVFVASTAVIGNGCKIQNNVSVYDGVELEDHVFVGLLWFLPICQIRFRGRPFHDASCSRKLSSEGTPRLELGPLSFVAMNLESRVLWQQARS